MMNCKNCNAELVDDAKFCPKCGVRVDGKKECPHCGREIAEDSVFCTYCGKRLDGKKVCEKCREVFDGDFCPKCGTPVMSKSGKEEDAAARKLESAKTKTEQNSAKSVRVLYLIRQSSLYAALCVMFICSFFVTFSLQASAVGTPVRGSMNSTSFYFFIDQFTEIKDTLAEIGTLGTDYFGELPLALYLLAGLSAACVAAIIVICAIYFSLGTAAFVKSIKNKQEIAMSKYVVTPAVLFLTLMIFVRGLYSFLMSYSGVEVKIGLGAVPIVNIVLVSVALAAAAVLCIIAQGRAAKAKVLNYALNAGGLILVFILIAVLPANILSVSESQAVADLDLIGVSAPMLFFSILATMGVTPTTGLQALTDMMTNATVAFILYIVVYAVAVTAMLVFAKSILNEKSLRCRVLSCVFTAVSVAVSIAYLVMGIIICNENFSGAAKIGASPICALIFSVFSLAMSIVIFCLLSKQDARQKAQDEPVNSSAEL